MITTAFILLIYTILDFFIGLFPTSTGFPIQVDTAIAALANVIHFFDDIIPMSAIFDVIIFVILPIKIALFVVWSLIFVARFVRG